MEKMGELGDLGWELRSLEAFLQLSWAVEQRHKGLPKGSKTLGVSPRNFLALLLQSLLGCQISHLTSLASVISYK